MRYVRFTKNLSWIQIRGGKYTAQELNALHIRQVQFDKSNADCSIDEKIRYIRAIAR
jgi:hypothetical protein